ncbi:hypothetical protein [Streptomyces sp. TRM64462]|uniref:COG4315 family predicted lipoprotein n=1 Tax=Streptomyces sp. TRM64462 TaxID=2741726 RepID=UPI0015863347|nr:hypothetical protein [Streptomyces sp. TRM64462]
MSPLRRVPFVLAGMFLLVAVAAGCGGDGGGDTGEQPRATGSPQGPATVAVRSTGIGDILVDADGRTLYLFASDREGESTCYDACAVAWPPLLTQGDPEAGEGAREPLLGTMVREDGQTAVTYDGQPLYHYQGDDEPGDLEGQGIQQFGARWYVVGPDGERITATPQDRETPGGY